MLNASAEDIFPPETDGLTFEWDTTGIGSYQPTARTGAPATGVRFILYAVNGLTGLPTEPLTEVGYVDLADESTASVAKLHVTVAGVSGTPVYINYTTTLQSLGESSARIGTAG